MVYSSYVGIWPCFFSFHWDADCFLVPKFKHCRIAGAHVCERIFGYSPIPGISLISLTSSHAEGNYLLRMLDSTKGLGHPHAVRNTFVLVSMPQMRQSVAARMSTTLLGASMALFPNIFLEIPIGYCRDPHNDKKFRILWIGCLISPSSKTSQMACTDLAQTYSSKMQWHSRSICPTQIVTFLSALSRSCPLANPSNGKDHSHSSDSKDSELFRMGSR
jgi:hypothetical protein